MTFTEYVHLHLIRVLFLACAILVWVAVNYCYPNDPVALDRPKLRKHPRWILGVIIRSLLASGLILVLSRCNYWLAAFTLAASLMFPLVRGCVQHKWLPETEVLGNLAYVGGLAAFAYGFHLQLPSMMTPKFLPGHVAVVLLITSIVLYMRVGGTNLVRGILEKGRILPLGQNTSSSPETLLPTANITNVCPCVVEPDGDENPSGESKDKKPIDTEEYNHGRLIGNVERILLLALVAIQAYQALAFLMTAKGLFRAKDLESRSFSEYFLVGTLVSSVIAVAAGLFIQLIIKLCW